MIIKINELFNSLNTASNYLSWLLITIASILARTKPNLAHSNIRFENMESATKGNSKVLQQHDYNLDALICTQPNTIISPRILFRPPKVLATLLQYRQNREEILQILTDGCFYPSVNPVNETTRQTDLLRMIKRGNHKSALSEENKQVIEKTYDKEISFG